MAGTVVIIDQWEVVIITITIFTFEKTEAQDTDHFTERHTPSEDPKLKWDVCLSNMCLNKQTNKTQT